MIQETIISGFCEPLNASPEGVELRTFVSRECGATGFSTGTATFKGSAVLPYHLHECSEAITILAGAGLIIVEGRGYRLGRLDCMHIPAGAAHCVQNAQADCPLLAHWSFGSPEPRRTYTGSIQSYEDRSSGGPEPGDPEHLNRFCEAAAYEPAQGTWFCDLFAKRFGSVGICGGYGRFIRGSSLPCHTHAYDESITILSGSATCLVQGARYDLTELYTAFVPCGKPHRFLNSGENEMEMLWVYAGDEPDRTLVDNRYCSGLLPWPTAI
jgi:mannose-6-phosphate isomerase-like protein (cupin superfamily)